MVRGVVWGEGGSSLLVLSLRTESRDSCFRETGGGLLMEVPA